MSGWSRDSISADLALTNGQHLRVEVSYPPPRCLETSEVHRNGRRKLISSVEIVSLDFGDELIHREWKYLGTRHGLARYQEIPACPA